MDAKKSLLIDDCVILIDSILCSTISNKMLGTGCNLVPVQKIIVG